MEKQYIEFKKKRELGEILNDTFAFLRSQFKPLMTTFFKIVGPYLLVMLLAVGFYLYSFGSLMGDGITDNLGAFETVSALLAILVLLVSAIASYTLSQSTILYYIKSYTNGKGSHDFAEIKKEVYASFFPFIGLGFMTTLAVIAGLFMCCVPGVYLYVPLVLSFSILVFDHKSASDAFGYSFTLIKGYWWITFATIFVIMLVVGIAGYAFNIPALIYGWLRMGIFSGEVDVAQLDDYGFIDPIYILLNLLGTLGQFLMNVVTIIAVALIYFNLNERKNFTGTYEKIENLGSNI